MKSATVMRLRTIVRKEIPQILHDPSRIVIAFVMPLVLLLLFGYGVSLDARQVRLALVVKQPDTYTSALVGAFQQSDYFAPLDYRHIHNAEQALAAHEVDGIVWLRNDFSRRLLAGGNAVIGVFVNGTEANQARITQSYIECVWRNWLASYARDQGHELQMLINLQARI